MAAMAAQAGASIISGILQGKSAKKVAKIQAQTASEQIAAQKAQLQQQVDLNQPAITRGNSAADLYGGFLGVGDQAQSDAALQAFRGSTGYQDLLKTGLGAVNASAYARGMGNSGAAMKQLQDRGAGIANQSYQGYLGNLNTLIGAGTQAAGNVAGVSQNVTNQIGAISQNSADAASNAALAQGSAYQGTLQNLGNIAADYFSNRQGTSSSSYTPIARTGITAPTQTFAQPGYIPLPQFNLGGR